MAVGFTLYCPAYLGADPWVGSKTAKVSDMFAADANPSPPTNWAHKSEIISPNKLDVANTV